MTPRIPRESIVPGLARSLVWNFFSLLVRVPTLTGPMIVHRMAAQMTIKYISERSPCAAGLAEDVLAKIPLLSAMDAVRNPISPREITAVPMIDAGYSERGFGILVRF